MAVKEKSASNVNPFTNHKYAQPHSAAAYRRSSKTVHRTAAECTRKQQLVRTAEHVEPIRVEHNETAHARKRRDVGNNKNCYANETGKDEETSEFWIVWKKARNESCKQSNRIAARRRK